MGGWCCRLRGRWWRGRRLGEMWRGDCQEGGGAGGGRIESFERDLYCGLKG